MLWTMVERARNFEQDSVLPPPAARDTGAAPRALKQASRVAAIVLAAGMATRLGGRSKPLLQVDGVPLIRHLVRALADAGVSQVAVVTGHRAEEIEAVLVDCPVALVRNRGYAAGQLSSLRAGLAALPRDLDGILVALGDQPLLTSADLKALLAAFARRGDADIVRPRAGDRLGNPIVMTSDIREAVTAGPPDSGVRYWMAHHPERVTHFDTDCEHYFIDIDTLDDLQLVRQRAGRDLALPQGAQDA